MKKLLILLLIIGCKELPETEKTGVWLSNGSQIEIITVDSCEYLWYDGESQTALAHKGNCKNTKH